MIATPNPFREEDWKEIDKKELIRLHYIRALCNVIEDCKYYNDPTLMDPDLMAEQYREYLDVIFEFCRYDANPIEIKREFMQIELEIARENNEKEETTIDDLMEQIMLLRIEVESLKEKQ